MHDADTVLVISSPDQLYSLDSLQVVVFTHAVGPLNKEQELALGAFVERGGGLVCSGDTIEAYHDYAMFGDLLGGVYGACIPHCELIAHVATEDHYITRRADSSFAVVEEIYLLDHIPADAEVLWRLSWRYTSRVLAYTRAYGKGRVFCTTLGSAEETSKHPVFAQMLERAIRYVAGAKTEEQPVRVALLGYGVIGLEHATAITSTPGLTLSLVCDRDERRLRRVGETFPDVSTCTDMAQILDDPAIDAVIISTPPNTHAPLLCRCCRPANMS
ncbi:hypothetical protein KSF_016960 [Reticulibacter mediterranei]|uniref:Gfo/Idh/MocA-like oxidoreductase N-terminal domain-containing protein n=1 Tax=Reticulibacter mediterranei TaxID=2778369 RepID=A0A8J3IFN8_9CHLR|nr:ThuA domain-containing protein [Reticulibacter mediterranei]GHO91648.1 hypothetical protein KSF_016960 [Reticulibacter mediterranei]